MEVDWKMKQPTAQEFIDLPDNINRVEIGQWYTKRMRELRKEETIKKE